MQTPAMPYESLLELSCEVGRNWFPAYSLPPYLQYSILLTGKEYKKNFLDHRREHHQAQHFSIILQTTRQTTAQLRSPSSSSRLQATNSKVKMAVFSKQDKAECLPSSGLVVFRVVEPITPVPCIVTTPVRIPVLSIEQA